MAITSHLYQVDKPGEVILVDWQGAGLLKPSVLTDPVNILVNFSIFNAVTVR
jgi:hypothetical protein